MFTLRASTKDKDKKDKSLHPSKSDDGRPSDTDTLYAGSLVKVATATKTNQERLFDSVIKFNREELKSLLVQEHLDPNTQDRRGFSMLHLAVQQGNIACVQFLTRDPALDKLSNRVNVNLKDKMSRTPLLLATLCYHEAMQKDPPALEQIASYLRTITVLLELNHLDATVRDDEHNNCIHHMCQSSQLLKLPAESKELYNNNLDFIIQEEQT